MSCNGTGWAAITGQSLTRAGDRAVSSAVANRTATDSRPRSSPERRGAIANPFAAVRRRACSQSLVERPDRKSVVKGKSGSVRVDLGGRRNIKKKKKGRN